MLKGAGSQDPPHAEPHFCAIVLFTPSFLKKKGFLPGALLTRQTYPGLLLFRQNKNIIPGLVTKSKESTGSWS